MTTFDPEPAPDPEAHIARVMSRAQANPPGVLPSLVSALDAYARGPLDFAARRRLSTYRVSLGALAVDGGPLAFRSWRRDPSGRIHVLDPPVQQIARVLREHIVPRPGHLFLDADWRSAHVAIAAARAGDEELLAAATSAGVDLYA